jgi:hypothetical protein
MGTNANRRAYQEATGVNQSCSLRKNNRNACHSEAGFIGEESACCGSEAADSLRDNAASE